jgi:tetratricopeptide (TPR) repeat protein
MTGIVFCGSCGAENATANHFCMKCGQPNHRISQEQSTISGHPEFNYNDFGCCPSCQAVNLIAIKTCKKCVKDGQMVPLPGSYFKSAEFWVVLVIFIVGFAAIPVSIGAAIRMIYMIVRQSSEQTKARERIRLESQQTFRQLKDEQIGRAQQALSGAKLALDSGQWPRAYDLVQESIVLADLGAEQQFCAARAALETERFEETLTYLKVLDGFRDPRLAEVRARGLLGVGKFDESSLAVLAETVPALSGDIRSKASVAIVTQWIRMPFLDDRIERFLLDEKRSKPDDVPCLTAVAKYHFIQGRTEEAISFCRSIPTELQSVESLAVYSELLRMRAEYTAEAFDIFIQRWELVPDDVEHAMSLVKACIARRDVGRAEGVIRSALNLRPDDQRLRYHLALVLKSAGRLQDCIAELQELLRLPANGAFRSQEDLKLLMVRCLFESGLYEPAHRQLQGMMRSREVLELLYEIGSRYAETGKNEKANDCWADIYSVDVRFRDVAARVTLA